MDSQDRQRFPDPAEVAAEPEKRPWSKPTITAEHNVFDVLQKTIASPTGEDTQYTSI